MRQTGEKYVGRNLKNVNVVIPHLSAFWGNEVFHINEFPKQVKFIPLLMLEHFLKC